MPLENTDAEERITRETMIGWIEHWGESYDDVRPDDGAMRLANRIIEYNAATETIEALPGPRCRVRRAGIHSPAGALLDGRHLFRGLRMVRRRSGPHGSGPHQRGAAGGNGRPGLRRAPHPVHRGERGHSRRYGRTAVGRADHRSHARISGLRHDLRRILGTCAHHLAQRGSPTTGRSSWPNHAPRANGRPTRTGSPYWA